jgi:hypothetical protein
MNDGLGKEIRKRRGGFVLPGFCRSRGLLGIGRLHSVRAGLGHHVNSFSMVVQVNVLDERRCPWSFGLIQANESLAAH